MHEHDRQTDRQTNHGTVTSIAKSLVSDDTQKACRSSYDRNFDES